MSGDQSYRDRRRALAAVARQTKALTPTIMADLPHLDATHSELLTLANLPPLDPAACPGFVAPGAAVRGTPIRVLNQDSFDAAIAMTRASALSASASTTANDDDAAQLLNHLSTAAQQPAALDATAAPRVAVLNMASDKNPGGGWLGGSSAQEEALCFRSTLAASLSRRFYPFPPRGGLYSRDVVVFREGMGNGHGLMSGAGARPVVSVLSVAGVRRPEVEEAGAAGRLVFAESAVRELTKDKMRLCLRMAASRGHVMLVLGALGCGAFRNPPHEVADCWMEVLSEDEFAGGWFREIWFAVYDRKGEGNFEIFRDVLDGKIVGEVASS
ncbi:hypothetical protein QBC33DRAFT_2500 [Phialemonium atrogriseum]|uniref:Microbial-type PARG catalytic domain-containing protein n=1 Tax=Phialemonium atrogriseum TaxID=1093897 RepID=A0AAJ0C8P8_9PEZI|nr:uncharacterized protein QBC33DRAFT_2500 [Phialemonium atrogriseum]KAK1772223.1 hypothetical protein QBC33DRAFT_2500 [Phialemonium atrogriseum]